LILLAALIKLLEWLGILGGLVEFLKRLWDLLRRWYEGGWPQPPEPEAPSESSATSSSSSSSESSSSSSSSSESEEMCTLNALPDIPGNLTRPHVFLPRAAPGNIRVGQTFEMNAWFDPPCRRCEYRQFIKGYARVRKRLELFSLGGWQDVRLVGASGQQIPDKDFVEDGKGGRAYGRRQLPDDPWDRYLPPDDRLNGCAYQGGDAPSIGGLSLGDHVDLKLDFMGRIVDVPTGHVVWEGQWSIHCYGQVGMRQWFDLSVGPPWVDSEYTFNPF
jgi:hypothetical protein